MGLTDTVEISDLVIEAGEDTWMNDVPEFANWIGSLSEKSLYKHLLESLNHASDETQGESIIEELVEADLEADLEAAHAIGDDSDDESQ